MAKQPPEVQVHLERLAVTVLVQPFSASPLVDDLGTEPTAPNTSFHAARRCRAACRAGGEKCRYGRARTCLRRAAPGSGTS